MARRSVNRRQFLKASGLAASTLALAGVSTAGAAPSAPAPRFAARSQSGKVTLQFAHMNSWNADWTADLDAMVADWNSANPDVNVETIKWDWGTYFATMTAAIGAGAAPDVMNVGWGEVVEIGKPHFLDLAPMLSAETKASFYDSSFRSCTYGNQVFGLPVFEQMNQVLYYRDDFAKAAGVTFGGDTLTWQALVDAAKALTTGDRFGLGVNGLGRGIVEPFAPFQYQNNSPMVAQQDGKWVSTFDSDAARAAGKYFVDLWTTDKVVNQNNVAKGYTDLVTDLGLGSVAMFHGVTQNYFALVQQYPDLADKIKIAPPQANASTATVGGAFTMSVFKYSKAPEQAVKFVEFATSKDSLAKYWLPKGQVLSPRKDVPSPGMPSEIEQRMRQYQAVQQVFPFASQWETVREKVLTPRLQELVTGQSDFDSTWSDIHAQAQLTLRNSE